MVSKKEVEAGIRPLLRFGKFVDGAEAGSEKQIAAFALMTIQAILEAAETARNGRIHGNQNRNHA